MTDLDPRQELFASLYTDPKSPTFSNATRSAIKAGYTPEYADNITSLMPEWLSEIMGDMKRLKKAEENLDMFLNYGDDPKIQADITKFVAGTLGKRKYSTRSELTGKEGKDLIPKPIMGGTADVQED
jgi:hypothetical protein